MNTTPTNWLNGTSCYLSGPMESAGDRGESWRNQITPLLESLGINVIDPTKKSKIRIHGDMISESDIDWDRFYTEHNYDFMTQYSVFRHIDLRLVDKADFLIVKIFKSLRSCGTWEEVFLANREKKPVIVWSNSEKYDIPGWLFWTLPHQTFFSSIEQVMNYLDQINSGKIDDANKKRWLLPV